MNSISTDFSQYRDVFSEFKILGVTFEQIPITKVSTTRSDLAMGVFAVRQGIFDITVSPVSVTTAVQYPFNVPLRNQEAFTRFVPCNCSNWFPNSIANTSVSPVPKFNYYFAWYAVASTNTAQNIFVVKIKVLARGRII